MLTRLTGFITLTLLFISCSKSDDSTTSGCTLASLTELYNGATVRAYYYTFDNQGRVSRIDFDSKPSSNYETYTYSADKIVVGGAAPGNGTSVYELDASGRVTRNGTTTFTYNAEGYLTQSYSVNGPHTTTIHYHYHDGNMVHVEQVGNYGGPQPVITTLLFEYDAAQAVRSIPPGDPINLFGSTREVLGSYFGKGSKNLVKKQTAKTTGYPEETRTHTYTRDDKGYITTVTTLVSDGRVGVKQLAYTCN